MCEGFDWLAFAHVVIAILFIGVLRDPVRNIWVVEFGMIACILILPFAFVMGHERGIPLWWQLIDCSFGVFGMRGGDISSQSNISSISNPETHNSNTNRKKYKNVHQKYNYTDSEFETIGENSDTIFTASN